MFSQLPKSARYSHSLVGKCMHGRSHLLTIKKKLGMDQVIQNWFKIIGDLRVAQL